MKKPFVILFCFVLIFGASLFCSNIQVGVAANAAQSESRPSQQELDIALVLDNSGSMKQNDPQFLTREVVTNFMEGFGEKSRFAMIIFDQEVKLVEPLTDLSGLVARANFLSSLEQVNYKGLFSDSPAAIERAVYELKLNGRSSALKLIILLTDGIVDTGDKARDLEKTKWLKEDLASECRQAGIKIFGIAFTDKADFHLIQTLAFKTEGEYFRAFRIEDIQDVFEKISQRISTLPSLAEPASADTQAPPTASSETSVSAARVETAPAPEPEAAKAKAAPPPTVPAASRPAARAQPQTPETLVLIFLIGIFVLLATIVTVMALNRRAKIPMAAADGRIRGGRHEPAMPRAELIDVKNITAQKTLEVRNRIVRIGRDTNNDVAIPEETVSSFHATIEYRDGFFYLEDQRSKNKTYLNGEEVAPYAPKKLKSGDVITVNVYKFIFILPDLIPAGETVLDLSGQTEAEAVSAAVVGRKIVSAREDSAMPEAMLIDVKNITGKKTLRLYKDTINVGRGVHNDIAIPQDSVSGSHAVIQYKDGSFYIEDQRSKNKTRLNGDEIAPYAPAKLKSGDEIMIDIHKFIFLLEQQTPSGDTDEHW